MNYYEKHVGDWIKDTVSLDMTEDGAYNRLVDQCYQSEKPLPADIKEVYRLARANKPAERKAVDYVLGKFFDLGPDGYTQKRVQAEIARYSDKQAKARASADARWNKAKSHSDGNANASGSHDGRNALQSPVPSNQTPDTKKDRKPARAPAFEPPDWVNRQHWDVWHSTAKRKKATPEQRQMAVDKLAEWRAAGLDYATALENAAIGGNQGLFLPSSPQGRQSAQARTINALTGGLASPKDSHALTLA